MQSEFLRRYKTTLGMIEEAMSDEAAGPQAWTAARHFIVGIGGTGCLGVQYAQRYVRDRFGGELPPNCQFMVVDSTSEEYTTDAQLAVGDLVNIAGFNADPYFEHVESYDYLDWLPAGEYLPGELTVGAHGRPHIGRLCYFVHREGLIKSAVEAKLEQLTEPGLARVLNSLPGAGEMELEPQPNITVHLLASVCGGAGAGCLLDMAYDLRKWCRHKTGHEPVIVGHLVLPDAFRIRSPAVQQQHKTNAYVVLSQINHFMGPNKALIKYKRGPDVEWPRIEGPFQY